MATEIKQFRIYYDDGTTHDDDLNTIPNHYGVLVILQRRSNDGRWFISSNAPYYGFSRGEWLHFYNNDIVDYLVNKKPIESLLVGRMVDKGTFFEVYEQAKADRAKMG